jgi:hypothetical protein
MVKREEIHAGDFIVNNDVRKPGDTKRVEAVYKIGEDWYAEYRAGRRRARVRLDRIYKQGDHPYHRGWTLANATQ